MSTETPAPATRRLFVAFPLPRDLLDACMRIQKQIGEHEHVRWMPRENLHLTGYFIGEVKPEQVAAIATGLAAFGAGRSPFTLRFERIAHMPAHRPRMTWLAYAQDPRFSCLVAELRTMVAQHTSVRGLPDACLPHVTLARFGRSTGAVPPLPAGLRLQALIVSRLELWESTLSPSGACYTVLRGTELSG